MYKICLIGNGYWGSKLARNFYNSEFFKLASIVDKKKTNLNFTKKKYPSVTLYTDYKKAIKETLIDLVIVASPTSTHFKIAKYALENYKHVLVEKPLSLSLKEVIKLHKIAKIKNKFIFVDYPFLFSGSINYLKKIIENKKYGKILEIESFREQAPLRKDANVIWDLCTHDISILTFLLNALPYKIKSIKKKNFKNYPLDSAYTSLKYKKKLSVLIKNSWVSPTKIRLLKIKFQKAILYCDENESMYKIKIYTNKSKNNWDKYNVQVPDIDLTEPLSKMVKYIFNSIKNKKNKLFDNMLNEKITLLLEKINKNNA